jgi:hypothetical protein
MVALSKNHRILMKNTFFSFWDTRFFIALGYNRNTLGIAVLSI